MNALTTELAIVHLPIGDLRPDPANPRLISDEEMGSLTRSIREFGFVEPVVVRREDNVVIGGHQRVLAAHCLGMQTVPVVLVDLSQEQARLLNLALNRISGTWDDELLARLLSELNALPELDLSLSGFSEDELNQFIKSLDVVDKEEDPGAQIDRAEELRVKWGTERGQVWEIGRHRLMCGDSKSPEDIGLMMKGDKCDLIVTSPPYNQGIDKFHPSGMHKEGHWVAKVADLAYPDSMPESNYQKSQSVALSVWYDVLNDGASVFYNHKNRYRDKEVVSPLRWLPGPFRLRQEIIWSRHGSLTQNARMFMPSDERIYWMYKGEDFYFNDLTEHKTWSTVWDINLETNLSHAVGFPVELPRRCIMACSRHAQIVLDPFMGSGTTMVAAEQLDRICYGMEIEPKYVAVILERMVGMGLEPRLV